MCFSTPMLRPDPPTRALTLKATIPTAMLNVPSHSVLKDPALESSPFSTHKRLNGNAKRKAKSASPGEPSKFVIDLDLNVIGKDQARKIMSTQHKILGYRPPPGSLAAEAQAAAALHPTVDSDKVPSLEKLKAAARADAERILSQMKSDENTPLHPLSNGIEKSKAAEDAGQIHDRSSRSQRKSPASDTDPSSKSKKHNAMSITINGCTATAKYGDYQHTELIGPKLDGPPPNMNPASKPKGLTSSKFPSISRANTSDSVEIICEILS